MPQLCTGLKMCATVEICPSFSFRGWKVPCCQKRNLPRDFEGRKNYAACVKKKGQSTCVTEIDDFADTLQLFLLELCWNFLSTWEIDCSILILFLKFARFWSCLLMLSSPECTSQTTSKFDKFISCLKFKDWQFKFMAKMHPHWPSIDDSADDVQIWPCQEFNPFFEWEIFKLVTYQETSIKGVWSNEDDIYVNLHFSTTTW